MPRKSHGWRSLVGCSPWCRTELDTTEATKHQQHSQGYGLPSGHIWLWELDHKEVLEKTPESPLDCKKIKPVNLKGNQLWIFTGRTDTEAETPILWPPDVKSGLTGKDPDAGEDWGQEEKRTTDDEMVGRHHWHNGHEFEQTLEDSEGQESPACCSSWGGKGSDTT